MCGIAGYYDARRAATIDRIQAMTDRLVHRGPDDHGTLLIDTRRGGATSRDGDGPFDLALGHRRLSILDLSKDGHQPMRSACGRYWVVYNGEIYNYLELREVLQRRGHSFHTASDTEVLLAAYSEWGTECLARFNGMWAFALWDARERRLFCARDRFGEKPLYYASGSDWFVFASEIKALFAHPAVPRKPNDAIVYDFLALRMADHTPETFFDGVVRVPAAHYLTFQPGNAPRLHRYWDCTPAIGLDAAPEHETRQIERFRELVDDSVRLRLRSDVPIGTCLSGGLDSSSIVATANQQLFDGTRDVALTGDRQRTFSACFDDPRFDERRFIDQVVATTGASTHRVFPSETKLWDELPSLVAHMDEPFHSTSQYSQWNVMRLVRESGVTVTLDGQGADELLAGYPGYHAAVIATLVRAGRAGAAAREAIATARLSGRGRSAVELALRTAYGLLPTALSSPLRSAVAPRLASLTPEGRSLEMIRPELRARFAERRLGWVEARNRSSRDLGAKLHADLFQFSLPALLRYADRNSMAFSVESRMPMLDYRIAEHVLSLPLRLIVRDGWTKYVFRRAMEGRLPREVQWRKDKMGFVTPEGEWLHRGRAHVVDMLSGELVAANYLDAPALRARLDSYVNTTSRKVHTTDVFRWYILELWMRYAFGSTLASARPEAAPEIVSQEVGT
jgi:asparagine synthase (glutamine-hydrolysing)